MKKIFVLAFGLLVGVTNAQSLPPSDLTDLEATAGDGMVELTWTAAEDDGFIDGYRVYYGTEPVIDADDSYADDVYTNSSEPTFELDNLLNGVTYYFSVTAIDDDQNESVNYSNEVSATPIADTNPETEDTEGPKVISATHTTPNEVTVVMSEPIAETDPSSFILANADTFNEVQIESIRYNSENLIMTVPVDSFTGGETYEITATSAVEDSSGNPVSSGITDTVSFVAQSQFQTEEPAVEPEPEPEVEVIDEPVVIDEEPPADLLPEEDVIDDAFDDFDALFEDLDDPILIDEEPILENPIDEDPVIDEPKSSAPDLTAPLEAQGLKANTDDMLEDNQVTLTWETALDIDNDIADQVLYVRTGMGAWDDGYSLGKDVTSTTIDVQPNQNYQVRLVTIDNNDNESEGAVFSFSTNLAQSGPGTVVALALAVLIGMMLLMSRRRA